MQIQCEHFNCQTKIIDDTHVTDLTHSIVFYSFNIYRTTVKQRLQTYNIMSADMDVHTVTIAHEIIFATNNKTISGRVCNLCLIH